VFANSSDGMRTWTGAEVFELILSTYDRAKKRGERFIEMVKKKFDPLSEGEIHERGTS
jgi:hypothetical protein